jgi:hypothetical protein
MEETNLIARAEILTGLCAEVLRQYASIVLPHDVMAETIGANDHLMDDLLSHYNAYSISLDTFTRDELFDAVAMKFTTLGRWPLNMDSDETCKAFIEELDAKVREVGGDVIPREPEGNGKRTSHGGKTL